MTWMLPFADARRPCPSSTQSAATGKLDEREGRNEGSRRTLQPRTLTSASHIDTEKVETSRAYEAETTTISKEIDARKALSEKRVVKSSTATTQTPSPGAIETGKKTAEYMTTMNNIGNRKASPFCSSPRRCYFVRKTDIASASR